MSDRALPIDAPAPHPPGLDPRRWWALVVLCLAQFMVILDITVVNVALPTIGTDLQLDRTSLTGLVTAGSDGWGATTTLLWLATGLVLAGGFVAAERMAREPLVPLRLLARRPLLAGQLVMLATSGLLLATAGLGAGFVVATTTAMSHIDHDQAGVISGLLNTGHELGASLGVAVVSTIATASITSNPLGGRPPVGGFDRAFLACALLATVAAVAAGWLLPPAPGRLPATDRPTLAH